MSPEQRMKGNYDANMLMYQQPDRSKHEEMFTDDQDLFGEGAAAELSEIFQEMPERMDWLNTHEAPGTFDYDDDYNQALLMWNPRGATGFENNARMKTMFEEIEYIFTNVVISKEMEEQKIFPYKGTPKKWQVLDDDCFDKDQIEKI